jgi:hypothetical protein
LCTFHNKKTSHAKWKMKNTRWNTIGLEVRCKFQFCYIFLNLNKITSWVSKVTIKFYLIEG